MSLFSFCYVFLLLFFNHWEITLQAPNPTYAPTKTPANSPTFSGLSCNLTKYKEWKNMQYYGVLSADSTFWIYQTQPQIVLTNYLAMELAFSDCKYDFYLLNKFKAGRMGPITIQDCYDVMCNSYCLESDNLHVQAMEYSKCNCLQLSTQSDQISYTQPGDWCRENSAQLLCEMAGYCGVWGCDIKDFMCPRYEWDQKNIYLKGPGSCNSGNKTINLSKIFISLIISIVSLYFIIS